MFKTACETSNKVASIFATSMYQNHSNKIFCVLYDPHISCVPAFCNIILLINFVKRTFSNTDCMSTK